MKYGIEIIRTSDLTEENILALISLKNEHWKYSQEEHIRWFKENINEDDIHVFLKKNNLLIGYLDIVDTSFEVNNKNFRIKGIGNVCVKTGYEGRGVGSFLLASVKLLLKERNEIGAVLCRDELVKFYTSCGWKQMEINNLIINSKKVECNLLINDMEKIIPVTTDTLEITRSF